MDPYRVLGVPPGADPSTVRRAYRRLARVYHPDAGGSNEAMARVNAAYAALQGRRAAPVGAGGGHRSAPPSAARPEWPPRPSPRSGGVRGTGRRWAGGTRRWALGRASGQWTLTASLALGIHALAPVEARPTTGLLEVLVLGLALAVQASATPPGRPFAPSRDAATLLRILGGGASAASRLLVEAVRRCTVG